MTMEFSVIKNAVHPRLRGELLDQLRDTLLSVRFIPAYAGNSLAFEFFNVESPVHPRLRGELGRYGNTSHALLSFFALPSLLAISAAHLTAVF